MEYPQSLRPQNFISMVIYCQITPNLISSRSSWGKEILKIWKTISLKIKSQLSVKIKENYVERGDNGGIFDRQLHCFIYGSTQYFTTFISTHFISLYLFCQPVLACFGLFGHCVSATVRHISYLSTRMSLCISSN